MPLESGTALGVYEVTAKIGEGGMGEVYQALDTKLDRDVALKVLPEAFTSDPDRLARFEREARVLASLNHPNIAAIHGFEEADGIKALVLELVEGPTLADRIAQGAIPVEEALAIADQIAQVVEAAHDAGVIHRDLKPANIKVLDFWLGKALDTTREGDPSQSPTLTATATQMGEILGTAAYMSPEQARGKPVDKRADIWAFGAVLFEMLSGASPFPGEDVSHTLARVIERDPDWEALPDTLPPIVGVYVRRCLQKAPHDCVRDIGDVRLALSAAFDTGIGAAAGPSVDSRPPQCVAARCSLGGGGGPGSGARCGRPHPLVGASRDRAPGRAVRGGQRTAVGRRDPGLQCRRVSGWQLFGVPRRERTRRAPPRPARHDHAPRDRIGIRALRVC